MLRFPAARYRSIVGWFSRLPEDRNVVSIAHGMINRCIRAKLLDLAPQAALDYLQANDELVVVDESKQSELVLKGL